MQKIITIVRRMESKPAEASSLAPHLQPFEAKLVSIGDRLSVRLALQHFDHHVRSLIASPVLHEGSSSLAEALLNLRIHTELYLDGFISLFPSPHVE
jgi:hypothetical protein